MAGASDKLTAPISFEPIFMPRIWGGRRLESEFGKKLPPDESIGESWEIVDRSEAQSIVARGAFKGMTLHELWQQHREDIFGELPGSPRFPLLIKLLDAKETLSLQVHPPTKVAAKLGGEPKTEFWYVAATEGSAEIFVGLNKRMDRSEFEAAMRAGNLAQHVHPIRVKPGDAMFLPAGRFHAVGAGNLLVEIQQNSDTTYRVFDWNRLEHGKPRQLHIEQALESIDFDDVQPKLQHAENELLVRDQLFEVQQWKLESAREISPRGKFSIVCCLTGSLQCADVDLAPGEFFLVSAQLEDRQLSPLSEQTTLLRVTIPVIGDSRAVMSSEVETSRG